MPPLGMGEEALQTVLQHITFKSQGLADDIQLLQGTLVRLEKAQEERLERHEQSLRGVLEEHCARIEGVLASEIGKLQASRSTCIPLPPSSSLDGNAPATAANAEQLGDDLRTRRRPPSESGFSLDSSKVLQGNVPANIRAGLDRVARLRNKGLLTRKSRTLQRFFQRHTNSYDRDSIAYRLVMSLPFGIASATIIIANGLFIGYQTDLRMGLALRKPPEQEPGWLSMVNLLFVVLFAVELFVRIVGLKMSFIFGRDWTWNLFDCLLVGVSITESTLADAANANFMRVLRMLRFVRVVRVLRVLRFFRELRMLMCCVASSFWLLGWAMMLMALLMYVFSVIIVQAASHHILYSDEPSKEQDSLSHHWRSLPEAMFSMMMAISGGVEWEKMLLSLDEVSWTCRPLFALYVIFVSFGVANVINGVFVQKVNDLNHHDRDLVVQASMADADAFIHQVKGYLEEQGSVTNSLTFADLSRFIDKDEIWAYLKSHGLEIEDVLDLFKRLDTHDEDKVNIEQFVFGCMRLKGYAKGSDLITLLETVAPMPSQIQVILDQTRTTDRASNHRFERLEAELAQIRLDLAELSSLPPQRPL